MKSRFLVCLALLGMVVAAQAAQAPAKQKPTEQPAPTVAPAKGLRVPANVRLSPQAVQRVQLNREQFEQLRRSQQQAESEALRRAGKLVVPASAVKPAPGGGPAWTHKYAVGQDCNDSRPDVHPRSVEVCDNVDNNCDGAVDEGQRLLFFLDADGDTHGDPAQSVEACPADQQRAAREGRWLVPVGNDCDDNDPNRWQGCP